MSQKVTIERQVTTKNYYKPFSFSGNINGVVVKKFKPNLGDGDIYTSSSSTTLCSVLANLQQVPNTTRIRLTLRYMVWESSFNPNDTKGSKDCLYFDASQDYDVSEFLHEGNYSKRENEGMVVKQSTAAVDLYGTYNEAYIIDYFKGTKKDYLKPSTAYGNKIGSNRIQTWFPVTDLRTKIDGSGSELKGQGNIAVAGYVKFVVRRIDTIRVTTTIEDTQSGIMLQPTNGQEQKVTQFHNAVEPVLGRGYDITGDYANVNSCLDRVIDYKKLNDYRRIKKVTSNEIQSDIFSGEGLSEYTSSIEKSLSVKVAGGAFGISFSNETEKTFKEEKQEKKGYKYLTQKDVFAAETYTVQGCRVPSQLTGFLSPEFLSDLKTLSPERIIQKYGTHVVLGMKVGTRFFYNMKYQESSQRKSTASTFKNTTTVSYDHTGSVDKSKAPKEKSVTQSIYEDLVNGKISADQLKAYAEYLKVAQGTTPEQAAKNTDAKKGSDGIPRLGGSASVSYSENSASTSLQEDKTTEISCSGVGGNAQILSLIARSNDLSRYEKWVESANASNYCFCDFVPGTLIPIYELVPQGYRCSAQDIKRASESYQLSKTHLRVNPLHGTFYLPVNTLGNKSNTDKIAGDWELSSKSGKAIYWRVRVEMLNFDNGHCGCAVSIIVKEGGRSGNQSVLMSHNTYDIPLQQGCSQMSIDTDALQGINTFEAEAEWTGQFHGWHDATAWVNAGSARKAFDCDGHRVSVQIDGKGDDWDHVGVQGYIKIPWLGY